MPIPHDRRIIIDPTPGDIFADTHYYPHQIFIVLAIVNLGSYPAQQEPEICGYAIAPKIMSKKNTIPTLIASPFVSYPLSEFRVVYPIQMIAFDYPHEYGIGRREQFIEDYNYPYLRKPPNRAWHLILDKLKGVFTTKLHSRK